MSFDGAVPEAEYHAHPALGSTDLKNLLRSPAHFLAAKEHPVESDALRIGTLVHECILDPERWTLRAVPPKMDRRTKAGKAAAAEWKERVEAEGLLEVSEDDKALAESMRDAAMSSMLVEAVLNKAADREVSCFWNEPGAQCKARFDAMGPGLVVDLKTTTDASPGEFRKAVARYKYHVQAAHYSTGAKETTGRWPDFAIIAIEKTPPFASALYLLDEDALAIGAYLRERALDEFRRCEKFNHWPAYAEVTHTLSLPPWAKEEW